MATYVEGEAVETDSEDEQYVFNLSYMKIGNDNPLESPNIVVNNTKELLLKGNVVDGLTETEDLLNTPVATEITEDFSPNYLHGEPASPAEFFYENELLRRKINEETKSMVDDFIKATLAPVSKKIIETDVSLINTQLRLQEVTRSVKTASENTEKIDRKLKDIIEGNFLPNMKNIPEDDSH